MEVVITSLDALIHKATNATLDRPDPAALEAFCAVLSDSPNGAYVATRVIASRIRAPHPTEALLALDVLDACMKRCDASFRAEVDKFRFLNEMIKLVSPKYYGNKTAPAVRQKVLNLMHGWTLEYPRELKIRDAYEMLKKQGVVKDVPTPHPPPPQEDIPPPVPRPRNKEGIFQDDEKARLLQKLLQSKNPEDLQAANRLIKTMVKEDERRVEAVSRRITELQTVHNNARLLDEMLDQYRPGVSSLEDLDLIKELHAACTRLRPTLFKLAAETQQNEEMLSEVLEASDELSQVFNKYTSVILQGKTLEMERRNSESYAAVLNGEGSSLLDLNAPSPSSVAQLQTSSSSDSGKASVSSNSNLEVLGDIFSSINVSNVSNASEIETNVPVLKPMTVASTLNVKQDSDVSKPSSSQVISKGLADLDALGADLLKDSLPPSCKIGVQFNNKQQDKIPMNLLGKPSVQPVIESTPEIKQKSSAVNQQTTSSSLLDLDFLISKTLNAEGKSNIANSTNDELMVDISDDSILETKPKPNDEEAEITLLEYLKDLNAKVKDTASETSHPKLGITNKTNAENGEILEDNTKSDDQEVLPNHSKDQISPSLNNSDVKQMSSKTNEVKPLTDINISLNSITPGVKAPMTVFEESDGITVVLHFTKNNPRPDVSVIVVSMTSRNTQPIEDFKFHAVVPKGCKVRLLPSSGDSFPAFSPFLPPAAITQVMLIGRPYAQPQVPVFLKFVITYTCQEDSISEMGEVSDLPLDDL